MSKIITYYMLVLGFLLIASCKKSDQDSASTASLSSDQEEPDKAEAPSSEESKIPPCQSHEVAPPAQPGFAGLVDWINQLPKPLYQHCLIASLASPLSIAATSSRESAQPADGTKFPRLFFSVQDLLLGLSLKDTGINRFEMSQVIDNSRSIKATLIFPIEENLTLDEIFTSIVNSDGLGTTCGFCHRGEVKYEGTEYPAAFVSQPMKPAASKDVNLVLLSIEREGCQSMENAEQNLKCLILEAIYGVQAPVIYRFPNGMVEP